MTTIAYRDGCLAADSLTTSGGLRDGLNLKIRKIGPLLVAGAGASAICERFFDWVRKGMIGDSPWTGSDGGNSFIVAPNGSILVFGQSGPWKVEQPFYALGTGEHLALGAMAHGASAAEAVECAIRFDIYSGGPIRTITR